jgi:hypothetical protein
MVDILGPGEAKVNIVGSGERNATCAVYSAFVSAEPGLLGSGESNATCAVYSAFVSAEPGSSTVDILGPGEATKRREKNREAYIHALMHNREHQYVYLGLVLGGKSVSLFSETILNELEPDDTKPSTSYWQRLVGCVTCSTIKSLGRRRNLSNPHRVYIDEVGQGTSSEGGSGSGSGTGESGLPTSETGESGLPRRFDVSVISGISRSSETARSKEIRIRLSSKYKGSAPYDLIGNASTRWEGEGCVTLTPLHRHEQELGGVIRRAPPFYFVDCFLSAAWDTPDKVVYGYQDNFEVLTNRLRHAFVTIMDDGYTEFVLNLDNDRWSTRADQMRRVIPILARMVFKALYHINSTKIIRILLKQTPELTELFFDAYTGHIARYEAGLEEEEEDSVEPYITTPDNQEVSFKQNKGKKKAKPEDDMQTRSPFESPFWDSESDARGNSTGTSRSESIKNNPSLSPDPSKSETTKQEADFSKDRAETRANAKKQPVEDRFCDWCEVSVEILHNIRDPKGVIRQVCPTCKDICIARARAVKEQAYDLQQRKAEQQAHLELEQSRRAHEVQQRKAELQAALELKELELAGADEARAKQNRRARSNMPSRSNEYGESGSPSHEDERGELSARTGMSRRRQDGSGERVGTSISQSRGGDPSGHFNEDSKDPVGRSKTQPRSVRDQNRDDDDDDDEDDDNDEGGGEDTKSVMSHVSNTTTHLRTILNRFSTTWIWTTSYQK